MIGSIDFSGLSLGLIFYGFFYCGWSYTGRKIQFIPMEYNHRYYFLNNLYYVVCKLYLDKTGVKTDIYIYIYIL